MTGPQRNTPKGGGGAVAPKLTRVVRLDSLPLNQTYFTEEGYLVDRPILTSTGIFEYTNPDGTIRRELRLPEEVFKEESLQSYKGKPIIITHDAGLITKDNVHENAVGTILSEGYRSGNDVRAEIIIHDTDEMKSAGLKELSLGYNLDLDETPGEWNGQPYDAVQRNIVINHLALVLEARAGEQARLNIDSRDRKTKGAKSMSANPKTKKARRADGVMSPEDLAQAIAAYKARRAERLAAKAKADQEGDTVPVADSPKPAEGAAPAADGDDTIIAPAGKEDGDDIADQVQMVKDRRDRRDEGDEPVDKEAAMGVIAQQDGDMDILFDIIDTLLAERDFDSACDTDGKNCDGDEGTAPAPAAAVPAKAKEDGDDEGTPVEPPAGENTDGDDDDIPATNASEVGKSVLNVDAVDQIVRQRIQLGIVGRALNMDGLEDMGIMAAKKAVIRAVRPGMRLDGKSAAYINAAYDYAVADVNSRNRKDTSYQIKQMFNQDGRQPATADDGDSSIKARQRMIDRQQKKEDK
uniref:DUF2213 domain-containing protein n=1 Tax=Myoviridae sp. ctcwu24 TaxID=2826670 RepID=A0A8S5NHY7_9CAUD|nr:MAG TPA: protein of unknown function DUF2213 [Myoviridae sp. ctcwu24]